MIFLLATAHALTRADVHAVQRTFMRRVAQGIHEDLAGPCKPATELGVALAAWTPAGPHVAPLLQTVLVERRIAPDEFAAWVAAHPEVVGEVSVAPLERVLKRYGRRCPTPADAPRPVAPTEPAASTEPAPGPAWETDLEAALGRDKPVLLRFSAAWAAADQEMDRHSWSDPAVRATVERCFVPVRVDVTDPTGPNQALIERYGVNGVPTWLVLGPTGQALGAPEGENLDAGTLGARLEAACRR